MIYEQANPKDSLTNLIKSFWFIDSQEDARIHQEKIIPDGYPELIFHYGAPYRIHINGRWELQEKMLLAGQIKNYFLLENTGVSKMMAIKFQPWAIKELFSIDMSSITDRVIPIPSHMATTTKELQKIAVSSESFQDKVQQMEYELESLVSKKRVDFSSKHKAVKALIASHGQLSLKEIQEKYQISERALERYFKTDIGLSPKFYTRIIRFSYIFQWVQKPSIDWSEIVYKAGYYDQSHFIKNFKEFTGEDPSKYGFSAKNMGNFFLKP
jgi:AraC-like DNA-binding protein